ncbi:MAG TPA: ATP-binding cassette domain-containing protein, partial [Clostridia bacterium]|nr:ATP-binding cassette domain-containing protein [Clostridia bacterium]
FLTDKINKIKEAAGASERVLEILDSTCERTDGADIDNTVFSPAIKFDKVCFSYEENVNILDGLNLSIERGKKIAIVGPSGCGKSTVLKLLCGFHSPTRGEINIFGKNLKEIRIGSLRSLIALVTQDTYLFPVSVAENISYGCTDATMDEIVQAAKAANAYDFIMSLPEGFNTNIGERGAKLSGGQKQRIAVARAILKKAPILLLDEPTSALDSESEILVQEALDKVMEDRTTIIVTHRYSTIKTADEILVLDRGAIAQKGKHDELIVLNGIYRQLYEKQVSPNGSDGGEAIA